MISGTFTRLGRITLWLVFWPIGLWRSLAHGQRKRDRRIEQALRDRRNP